MMNNHRLVILSIAVAAAAAAIVATSSAQQQPPESQTNFPYYLQTPANSLSQPEVEQAAAVVAPAAPTTTLISHEELGGGGVGGNQAPPVQQRSQIPGTTRGSNSNSGGGGGKRLSGNSRKLEQVVVNNESSISGDTSKINKPQESPACLYEKSYFTNLDECLTRRPYPTIGLPAFKNEDLVVKRGITDQRHGCTFILNNGLFKNYQVSKFSLDNADQQCLDNTKVSLSMGFQNVSLAYLWTLRCLNRADQLMDDANMPTASSKSMQKDPTGQHANEAASASLSEDICIGSSQTFGFTSLQLTGVEALIELSSDIFKNWRITNITVAMSHSPLAMSSSARAAALGGEIFDESSFGATSIKDFVFESLDGDELNWKYLHLFQNWSRNRLHTNFLEQYRRFLWVSMQRCLSETAERLPVKLVDIFAGNQRLN